MVAPFPIRPPIHAGIAHSPCKADAAFAPGAPASKDGSILTVHGHDTDAADAVLLVSRSLAGMRLVRDCREGTGPARR